jgi:hypothetical protein
VKPIILTTILAFAGLSLAACAQGNFGGRDGDRDGRWERQVERWDTDRWQRERR